MESRGSSGGLLPYGQHEAGIAFLLAFLYKRSDIQRLVLVILTTSRVMDAYSAELGLLAPSAEAFEESLTNGLTCVSGSVTIRRI
jgi:hypothetical protein